MAGDVDVWMAMHWRDFFADTGDLDDAEGGAYLHLLGHMWLQGGTLPDDQERLRRLAKSPKERWPGVWDRIRSFFTQADEGRITQKRLELEMQKAVDLKEQRKLRTEAARAARHTRDTPHDKQPKSSVTEKVTELVASPVTDTPVPAPPPVPAPVPKERTARARAYASQEPCPEHPLVDPARTDLDADPRKPVPIRPHDSRTTDPLQSPESPAYAAALEIADAWRDLRAAAVPGDRTIQPGPWSLKRRQMADGLVEAVTAHGAELVKGALQMGWLDLGDAKRWPGWRSKMATVETAATTLSESQLVEQYRAYREAKARDAKESHAPPKRVPIEAPTQADLEEFRRARESVRSKIRAISGGGS